MACYVTWTWLGYKVTNGIPKVILADGSLAKVKGTGTVWKGKCVTFFCLNLNFKLQLLPVVPAANEYPIAGRHPV